ncbi:MAG: hypothetical protein ABIG20_03685 [archaeon]
MPVLAADSPAGTSLEASPGNTLDLSLNSVPYTLTITEVDVSSVTLTIRSETTKMFVKFFDSITLDIDEDSVNDLSLVIESTQDGKSLLRIEELNPSITESSSLTGSLTQLSRKAINTIIKKVAVPLQGLDTERSERVLSNGQAEAGAAHTPTGMISLLGLGLSAGAVIGAALLIGLLVAMREKSFKETREGRTGGVK